MFLTDSDLWPTEIWQDLLARTTLTRLRVNGLPPPSCTHIYMADTYRVLLRPGQGVCLNAGAAAIGLDPLSSGGICFALRSGRDAALALCKHFGGESNAVEHYCRSLDAYFEDYLDQRLIHYRSEQRWAESQFWIRRHETPAPISARDFRAVPSRFTSSA